MLESCQRAVGFRDGASEALEQGLRVRTHLGQDLARHPGEHAHGVLAAARASRPKDRLAGDRTQDAGGHEAVPVHGQVFERRVLEVEDLERLGGVGDLEDELPAVGRNQPEILVALARERVGRGDNAVEPRGQLLCVGGAELRGVLHDYVHTGEAMLPSPLECARTAP